MAKFDHDGALWTDFIESKEEVHSSMSRYSSLEADDIFLETAEIMSHDEDYFLHNGPAQRLGLV